MRKFSLSLLVFLGLFPGNEICLEGQEGPNVRVVVNLVQLNVAVTDKNGNYITGLHPKDFAVVEDGISEKVATFAEGEGPLTGLTSLQGTNHPRLSVPTSPSILPPQTRLVPSTR